MLFDAKCDSVHYLALNAQKKVLFSNAPKVQKTNGLSDSKYSVTGGQMFDYIYTHSGLMFFLCLCSQMIPDFSLMPNTRCSFAPHSCCFYSNL